MNRKTFYSLALSALMSSQPSSAASQNLKESLEDLLPQSSQSGRSSNLKAQTRIFDSMLLHHLPDWTPREIQLHPASASRIYRQRKGNSLRIDMVPKNETRENWSNRYTVSAEAAFLGNNVSHARAVARYYRSACRPANLNIQPLRGNSKIAFLVAACGSYAKNRALGEVGIFVMLQRGRTVARIQRQWRAPAFRSENFRQWPLTEATISRLVTNLTRARLVPLQ